MKITYLVSSLGAGGKERQISYLLKYLSSKHSIQLIVFSSNIFYEEIKHLPIQIDIILEKKASIKAIKQLNKLVKNFRPDIIHTWDIALHLPLIPYITFKNIRLINGAIRHAGKLKKNLYQKILYYFSYLTSYKIISNSRQGLIVEGLINNQKSIVIYNGIPVSETISLDANFLKNFPEFDCKIVMVARFNDGKDYNTFIEIAKKILFDNNKIGFFCIGDGVNKKNCEKLADSHLNTNIFFLGQRNDVHQIVNQFDIGVLLNNTNGHAEGISNSIMEYMAFGLPVVATNAGGTPELLNEDCGFLVPAFDVDKITSIINKLIQNPSLRRQLGNNAKTRIKEHFSLQVMYNSYEKLYDNSIKKL